MKPLGDQVLELIKALQWLEAINERGHTVKHMEICKKAKIAIWDKLNVLTENLKDF